MDTPTYNWKVAWTTVALKLVDSDVLGFQEFWHKKALEAIFAKVKLKRKYRFLVPPGTNCGGIVCTDSVKKDLLVGTSEWLTVFPDDFMLKSAGDDDQTCDDHVQINALSLPVLKFEVKPRSNDKRIAVFVAYLKFKLPTAVYKEREWYEKDVHGKHASSLGVAISTIRRAAKWLHSYTPNILTEQPDYLFAASTSGTDNSLYTVGTL